MKLTLLIGLSVSAGLVACGGAPSAQDANVPSGASTTGSGSPSTVGPNNLGAPAQTPPQGQSNGTPDPNKTGGAAPP